MKVRALFRAAVAAGAAPPYNTITVKAFYPARESDDPAVRDSGVFPADDAHAPFPVVLLFPGVNCESTMYEWLSRDLAADGLVVLQMTWIAENRPGRISLTPGIDLAALAPERYGQQPSASSLPVLLTILDDLNRGGVLMGRLNLNKVALVGHSAGGTLAHMNANCRFIPGIAASISLMANPLATSMLGGFPPGVLPPLPGDVPALMLGGTDDGIGTHHNLLYGRPGQSGADTVAAMFTDAFPSAVGDSRCVILRGANHYTPCFPLDDTVGRVFLDTPETGNGPSLRALISALVRAFLAQHLRGAAPDGERLLHASPLIDRVLTK